MKIALTKALGKATTIVSTLLIILSLLGTLNLAFPEYANFVMDMFGFTNKNELAFLTMGTAGTGIMGVIGKTLKNSFNTQSAMLVATQNLERDVWRKEKEELEINTNEFMEIFAKQQMQQVKNENEIIRKQKLALDFNVAYAKERLNMSDNLVPQEIKEHYRRFLANVENREYDIESVDELVIVEEVEKVVEIELTPQDVKQRNKSRNKRFNNNNNNKDENRIGVR